jgi:transposase-like protein
MAKDTGLKQYKITFHGEGGDIEIGHNFTLNLYKRNVETTIDENFLSVLKDAVVRTTVDGKEVSIPMYSYTVEPI